MPEENNLTPPPEQPVVAPDMLKLQKTLEAGKTVIGIDIGISSVNVAQTAVYHGKPTLIKVAVENIRVNNERDRDKLTVAALKKVLSGFNTKHADIVCVMPSLQTVVETMVMPVMPPEDLLEAVKIEISNSQYFVIDRPVLDCQVVGRVVDKGIEKMDVLVAAAPKTAIDALLANFVPQQAKALSGLERALTEPMGLSVDTIIPLSVALENIIKKSKLRVDETMAIIEMGTVGTELNIYRNSHLEFSRKIPVTGVDLTRSLTSALFTSAGKLELSMDEAESIKREFGIPAPGENYLIRGKITAGQVLALLRPKIEQLASEIGRAFDHYHEKVKLGKVDRVIVFGGGARLKGLPEFLNAELGLPVDMGNPVQDVEMLFDGVLPDIEDAQRLVQAIGASMSDGVGINLVPLALKDRKKKSIERVVFITGATVFMGLLVFTYFGSLASMNMARERAGAVRREYISMRPELLKLKDGLLLKKAVRGRLDIANLLKELSYAPAYVYFTDLRVNGKKVVIDGFVSDPGKNAKDVFSQLVADLRKHSIPDARLMPSSKKVEGKAALLFEITGNLGHGGAP